MACILIINDDGFDYAYPCKSTKAANEQLLAYVTRYWNLEDRAGKAIKLPEGKDPDEIIEDYCEWNDMDYKILSNRDVFNGFMN